jgi:hypothetical protein
MREEMRAKLDAHHKRMMARMDSAEENGGLCRKDRGHGFGGNSRRKVFESEQQEVPKEEATMKTVRALKERYGDWYLAVEHCQHPQKWTHGDGGSWKMLTATFRGMTHHAGVAQHKGCDHTGPMVRDD